jgi:hypothetical protein
MPRHVALTRSARITPPPRSRPFSVSLRVLVDRALLCYVVTVTIARRPNYATGKIWCKAMCLLDLAGSLDFDSIELTVG